MTCLTIHELKLTIKKSTDNQKKILNDINSNKPYCEKIYLKEFDRIVKKDRINNYCYKLTNYNGKEFFTNYYSSNNVIISGMNPTNYIGNSTPSPF
jgi:hypothetical protein